MTILDLNAAGESRSEATEKGAAKTILVNGKKYSVASEADTRLLFVLRDEIGMTGTKYGCGEGQCGACTVMVNGVARRSCLTPVADVVGKSITTIEGLEQGGNLHPMQAAFIRVDAFQCAYCTSGMIMSSVALLEKNPNPTDAEIRSGLQGNICRCGAHPRIVDAVRIAAKEMKARGAMSPIGVPALRARHRAEVANLSSANLLPVRGASDGAL